MTVVIVILLLALFGLGVVYGALLMSMKYTERCYLLRRKIRSLTVEVTELQLKLNGIEEGLCDGEQGK